jgi:alkylation response protein AidB-like acyl-CoA dehydrogenase
MTTNPTFTVTEEQQMLRSAARDLLSARGGSEQVRSVMMTDEAVDEAAYKELAQMGLVGLLVPEEHGGSGSGFVEVGIVAEELGRSLLPMPFLSSAVLATTAILTAGNDEQKAAHLPGLASGERTATLVHLDERGRLDADPGVAASSSGDGWTLNGTSGFVLDGLSADLLVVAATTDDGVALFVVPADASGVQREKVDVLDLTRPMATVRLNGVEVEDGSRLQGGAPATAALHAALTAGLMALASEQVGGARYVHEDVTEYARTRMQFGRAIGSFQAIKHRIADLMVELESATSAVMHAQRAVAEHDREEMQIAVPMAKAYASEVYEHIAGEAIQIYGGIGFTWEHDAHLYFKRAKASRLLLGSPHHHRRVLADVLGL